jgi:hypothetical protein
VTRHVGADDARVRSLPPAHRLNMLLRNGKRKLDAYRPTFDPCLDVATVVFSHVQCVRTRHSLARVSKIWRDASKTAAAYPDRFDLDAIPDKDSWCYLITGLLDNDEALSLPYERVVRLLGEAAEYVCNYAARRGSVRLLKWARENNRDWSTRTCCIAAYNGHLPALKYLHENGCPWNSYTCTSAANNGQLPALKYLHENGCPWEDSTCLNAAYYKRWDCLQYAVDNKFPGWEHHAEEHAEHLR